MIRKITYLSIALILLITSAGFSVSKHYCHNQLIETVVDQQAESCCGESNCCHTETLVVKLDEKVVSKATVSVPDDSFSFIFVQLALQLLTSDTAEPQKVEFCEFISPPPLKLQTLLSGLQTYLL